METQTTHQLHADAYCRNCGYNLRGQFLIRGDDKDIAVIRCPECGKFNPAGYGVTPVKLGATQAGFVAQFVWILGCIALFGFFAWFVGVMQYGYFQLSTTVVWTNLNGSPYVFSQSATMPAGPRVLKRMPVGISKIKPIPGPGRRGGRALCRFLSLRQLSI